MSVSKARDLLSDETEKLPITFSIEKLQIALEAIINHLESHNFEINQLKEDLNKKANIEQIPTFTISISDVLNENAQSISELKNIVNEKKIEQEEFLNEVNHRFERFEDKIMNKITSIENELHSLKMVNSQQINFLMTRVSALEDLLSPIPTHIESMDESINQATGNIRMINERLNQKPPGQEAIDGLHNDFNLFTQSYQIKFNNISDRVTSLEKSFPDLTELRKKTSFKFKAMEDEISQLRQDFNEKISHEMVNDARVSRNGISTDQVRINGFTAQLANFQQKFKEYGESLDKISELQNHNDENNSQFVNYINQSFSQCGIGFNQNEQTFADIWNFIHQLCSYLSHVAEWNEKIIQKFNKSLEKGFFTKEIVLADLIQDSHDICENILAFNLKNQGHNFAPIKFSQFSKKSIIVSPQKSDDPQASVMGNNLIHFNGNSINDETNKDQLNNGQNTVTNDEDKNISSISNQDICKDSIDNENVRSFIEAKINDQIGTVNQTIKRIQDCLYDSLNRKAESSLVESLLNRQQQQQINDGKIQQILQELTKKINSLQNEKETPQKPSNDLTINSLELKKPASSFIPVFEAHNVIFGKE